MIRTTLLAATVAVVAACAGSGGSRSTGSPALLRLSEQAPFSGNSGFPDSTTRVVRDSASWRDTWQTIHSWTSEPPPVPQIDFGSRMVLLAAAGTKGSGGHGIEIRSVTTSGTVMTARVRTTSPGPSCFTTMALTEPVDVVTVPQFEGTVRFEYEAVVYDCEE